MLRPAALSLALALPLLACSAAPGETSASTAAPLASPTSTFLIPKSDDVRAACRGTWTTRFCAADEARAAGAACVAAMDARPACASDPAGCFVEQTTDEACAASEPAYPDAASCDAPRLRNCAYYSACVESVATCGEDGYALGYGEKYCTRYLLDTRFSAAGMAWRDNVMHCLQESLIPVASEQPAPTCDTVLNDAFDSHPHCYTEGPSICFLPPSDVLQVVSVIDGKDLLSLRSAKQMASVAATCVKQLGWYVLGGGKPKSELPAHLQSEDALQAHIAMWQEIAAR